MQEQEEEEQGFTVRDRRIDHDARDAESGAPSTGAAPQPKPSEPAPETAAPESPAPESEAGHAGETGFALGGEGSGIDFSAFVFSLARTALIHLGLERHPETGAQEPNLEAARETIDVLAMIEEKTRGNLTAEEAELISKMLYTLRMSFVEVSRAGRPG
jgi:hypothetical protein